MHADNYDGFLEIRIWGGTPNSPWMFRAGGMLVVMLPTLCIFGAPRIIVWSSHECLKVTIEQLRTSKTLTTPPHYHLAYTSVGNRHATMRLITGDRRRWRYTLRFCASTA